MCRSPDDVSQTRKSARYSHLEETFGCELIAKTNVAIFASQIDKCEPPVAVLFQAELTKGKRINRCTDRLSEVQTRFAALTGG